MGSDWQAILQTTASIVAILGVPVATFGIWKDAYNTLVQQDKARICSDRYVLGYFHSKATKHYLLRSTPTLVPEVPSLSGLMKGGDTLAYSSSALQSLKFGVEDISWVKLYEVLLLEAIVRASNGRLSDPQEPNIHCKQHGVPHYTHEIESLWYPSIPVPAADFVVRMLYDVQCGSNRTHPQSGTAALILDNIQLYKGATPALLSSLRPFPLIDSDEHPAPFTQGVWDMKSLILTRDINSIPFIQVSRYEMAALSLAFGMSFARDESIPTGGTAKGAYGLYLDRISSGSGVHPMRIRLFQDSRYSNSRGSGYSFQRARLVACGTLPFGQAFISRLESKGGQTRRALNENDCRGEVLQQTKRLTRRHGPKHRSPDTRTTQWVVRAIYVDEDVLVGIQNGRSIGDGSPDVALSIEVLRALPSMARYDIYGLIDQQPLQETVVVEPVRGRSGSSKTHITDSGAVVPSMLASWPAAVCMIAFGGLVPRAKPALKEAVRFTSLGIDEVGDLFEGLERFMNAVHIQASELQLFGANFQDSILEETTVSVKYARRGPWSCEYACAVFGRYTTLFERMLSRCREGDPETRRKAAFDICLDIIKKAYVDKVTMGSHRHRGNRRQQNLGDITNQIAAKVHVPYSLHDCATIARCLIVAWAHKVPVVEVSLRSSAEDSDNKEHLSDLPIEAYIG